MAKFSIISRKINQDDSIIGGGDDCCHAIREINSEVSHVSRLALARISITRYNCGLETTHYALAALAPDLNTSHSRPVRHRQEKCVKPFDLVPRAVIALIMKDIEVDKCYYN